MYTLEGIVTNYNEMLESVMPGVYVYDTPAESRHRIENQIGVVTRDQSELNEHRQHGRLGPVLQAAHVAGQQALRGSFVALTRNRSSVTGERVIVGNTYDSIPVGTFSIVARDGRKRDVPVVVVPYERLRAGTAEDVSRYGLAVRTEDPLLGRSVAVYGERTMGELWRGSVYTARPRPSLEYMAAIGALIEEVAGVAQIPLTTS